MSAVSCCRNVAVFSGMVAFLAFIPAAAQDFDAAEESRIKALALEAILENPEILQEAITLLQEKQQKEQAEIVARTLATNRTQLETDPNAPVLGNPEGGYHRRRVFRLQLSLLQTRCRTCSPSAER